MVEVKRLERVEQEITHILVHVNLNDAPIKVINYSATVHNLFKVFSVTEKNKRTQTKG
jgi:hypothetical protein